METTQYHFNIVNSIILGGIIQGLIFGYIVFTSKKYRDTATFLLATLIVVFSLNNLNYYLASTWLVKSRYLYGITWTPGQLIMAPLLYFYGLKILYPEKSIPRKTIITLVTPFTLGFIAVNTLKLTRNYLDHKTEYLLLEGIIEFVSIFLCTYLVTKLLLKTIKAERNEQAFAVSKVFPKLRWFRNTLIAFLIICPIWFTVMVMVTFELAPYWLWNIIWIALSVMIYWIGHIGIYKYGVTEERKKIRSHTLDRSSIVDVSDKGKSEHLTLFEDLVINKKYFLDPELTLDKIADELNLSKSHLSRLINTELKTSFPDYINQLRIKEAQYYLKHPDFSNYTLVAIGLEAGFASKTTFNNTFKKVTGMTPSEYKNSEPV
ncbi:helix-turn-helix domain-containing protein [Flavobacterium wongokense]|uniref:helix-turn-helix domain-containing protein n=1 Tax=Flavobacterium wongokense TaxID=2910674 RepID=UPI001F3FE201|nr:helix-turn-helix transcriptional regulator [Flavobacterium sp. WG47]MCF6131209.1 helix-turn-helix transcriptional regulator [Flavobacterium sp. WG47]